MLLPALLVWMLAFEVAASVWKVQVDYLLASDEGEYMLEGLRWLGWLPLAAALPVGARAVRSARSPDRAGLMRRELAGLIVAA